ncbi:gamma-glutamylcyclotransferase family protein [Vibrio zhugei]|uniref:Gamma-glutamylcyclotransferase family protein n=1 Tax=Vibrio zhugei TaxID=2479546 RepID=A0ABV7C649_9VIBR|nr:gamma-glutamylcyclotransferase family protein [Vibrio zhugei]
MYIFGYGSLMNSASRQLTGQTGQAIPVIVSGLVRHWGKIDDSYVMSPLVVQPGESEVNGVLLEVSNDQLPEFDLRERGYQRMRIPTTAIRSQHPFDKQQDVWVYVTCTHQPPCTKSPIVQSYVDTVLAGCLEVSEEFARHFVAHTKGWHHPQEKDRHAPIYPRMAGIKAEQLPLIDALLSEL